MKNPLPAPNKCGVVLSHNQVVSLAAKLVQNFWPHSRLDYDLIAILFRQAVTRLDNSRRSDSRAAGWICDRASGWGRRQVFRFPALPLHFRGHLSGRVIAESQPGSKICRSGPQHHPRTRMMRLRTRIRSRSTWSFDIKIENRYGTALSFWGIRELRFVDPRISRIAQLLSHRKAEFGCSCTAAPGFDYVALRREE